MKVFVVGTRGFPDVQGGVEKHCEELYPRIAQNEDFQVTVFTRLPYIKNRDRKNYKNVGLSHIWCPKRKSLEAIIHTFLGVIIAKFRGCNLIHFHAVGPALLIPLAKILKMKVVFTYHGPDYLRAKWGSIAKLVLKLGEQVGVKYADRVIVISKSLENYLKNKYLLSPERLIYIPNGVVIFNQELSDKALIKYGIERKKYFLSACRFVPEKGLDVLIQAFKKIDYCGFKLVIAGDADHESDYSKRLKQLARETVNIVLTGVISGEPLLELYSNAALFILPSYYEGLPIALLEALSFGLPVVVSDIEQNHEIELNREAYFKPGDVDDLANKLKSFIIDESQFKLNEKIHFLLKDKYNWDKIAIQTREVYLGCFE